MNDTPAPDPTPSPDPLTPPFSDKAVVVVRDDLLMWQRLNITAFLVSGLTAAHPELVGASYRDGDDVAYLRLLGVPVVVLEAPGTVLASARAEAVARGWGVAVYTREMFDTGHDAANRAAVRVVSSADLDLVGLGLHGPRNAVDKIVKGARLHG